MRIISQSGYTDLPYERTHIVSNIENVIARCDGREYLLGSYSTQKKAIKAMEMCQREYIKIYGTNGGIDTFTGAVTQPAVFDFPKLFRFPKDEEVRV